MSKPTPRDTVHSLDLIKKIVSDAIQPTSGKCGGDCSNCPCSDESPKSTKKASDKETSDPCDKC